MQCSWPLLRLFALVAASARVYSQPVSSSALDVLPHCALECLTTAIASSTCLATNQTCICTTESLQEDMTVCVTDNCTVKQSLVTTNATLSYCGVPVRHKSTNYVAVNVAFVTVSFVLVAQRFAFKIYTKLDLGLDDWFTLGATTISIPQTVITLAGVSANGLGHDIWTLPFSKIYNFAKNVMIMEVLYFAQITLLKLAMLFFYLRIFPSSGVRRLLWGTIIANTIYGISFVIAGIFQCNPISYFWNMWDGEHQGRCLNQNAIGWSNAAISIALDFWMLAIPLHQIRHLNLNWKRKVAVGSMFLIGSFVTVVSILRLRSLVKFGTRSKNPTWEYHNLTIWSTIEINFGIICTCMPSLRLVLLQVFPRLLGTSGRDSSNGNQNTPNRDISRRAQFQTPQRSSSTPSHVRSKPQAIMRNVTFTVESLENDEVCLVEMTDPDTTSLSKSGTSNVW
ncbi:hypothetical protein EDB80DRAFT_780000 [Ilyonectria destructans]|nr:hypothetical protein EDB80DRAFT_780000 [Ilyonectria destructans]